MIWALPTLGVICSYLYLSEEERARSVYLDCAVACKESLFLHLGNSL